MNLPDQRFQTATILPLGGYKSAADAIVTLPVNWAGFTLVGDGPTAIFK